MLCSFLDCAKSPTSASSTLRVRPRRKLPVRTNEVTRVTVRIVFQVVLMFGLSLPERTGWGNFRHHLARPNSRGINVGNGIDRNPLLLVAGIVNGRTIAGSAVVTLAIHCGGIMNLEEELQKGAVADLLRIEHNFDCFRVSSVIAVGGVGHVAA